MLRDDADEKWRYGAHTAAKHALLSKYVKAWLAILGQSGRRHGGRGELVLVDAFAGKGRYVDGQAGSPLILRQLAGQVAADQRVDEVELFFIEPRPANHASLVAELAKEPAPPGVKEAPVAQAQFQRAAERILELLRSRPSFWFIDPFGFRGMPLALLGKILRQPRAELFITFMSRDMNRFLEVEQHKAATMATLGLSQEELEHTIARVKNAERREFALRDIYIRRLREGAGARYVWTARVASGSAQETIYYVVHASNHIKAFKEMKDATFELWGSRYAFLGEQDYEIRSQLELPTFETGTHALRRLLLEAFAGRTVTYSQLIDEAYPDRRFHNFIEHHFRTALLSLVANGSISKFSVTTKKALALNGGDRLTFRAGR